MVPTKPTERTRVVPAKIAAKRNRASAECLVEIYGANLGRRVVLDHSPTLIGRGIDADVPIGSDAVSRRHAVIEQQSIDHVGHRVRATSKELDPGRRVDQHQIGRKRRVRHGCDLPAA